MRHAASGLLSIIPFLSLVSAFQACGSLPVSDEGYGPKSLNIVSIVNKYLPPGSDQSFTHLSAGVHDFNAAVKAAQIKEDLFFTVKDGLVVNEDLIRSIVRFDAPDTLSVVYIASHGSPEGFILKDELSYEDLYRTLEARTKGTILLLVDSCYSGILTEVLARHASNRIFAITGTKDASLERWYGKTGSYSQALAQAIQRKLSPRHDGKLTLGQLYDGMASAIESWNRDYPHRAGPVSAPGMYGPRNLVVFNYNAD
jgi:hypothetical protein